MRDQPGDLNERELHSALEVWGIHAATLRFTPLGFGDHHWIAEEDAAKWFVKVCDLDAKPYLGADRRLTFRALRHAMNTAVALQATPGMDFVVAPVRAESGETVHPLGARYAVSVFPYLEGAPGRVDLPFPDHERGRMLDMLAQLHQCPPPLHTPRAERRLPDRDILERALTDVVTPWREGPFAEPAREAIISHSTALWSRLAEFDHRLAELDRRGAPEVVTHGEPHPGNVIHDGDRRLLIDWDTVGLALPERDLWSVLREERDIERYVKATNTEVDTSALAFYRLRWDLSELCEYTAWFRAPHEDTGDLRTGWEGFASTLRGLAGG
ncbi:aminoglycoside phosphotransferase family protein [Spiractinospora alimapuensis]|uniref:phosphotransferase n=1 Tax=Spiractinospora alimapuensis TaxID=2820884 RepID=UPI001F31F1E7|nr:aminoglycoside phosphotransferase family protein [Spiractinospora alimapuensis]QVQ50730.1 aminoglycoside phosphotransferase family protein [Spiractinospora alimapuensis]